MPSVQALFKLTQIPLEVISEFLNPYTPKQAAVERRIGQKLPSTIMRPADHLILVLDLLMSFTLLNVHTETRCC